MTADFDANRIDLAREDDFRLGEILIRPSTRQVEAKGESQTLQPRIMQVLVALARRQGQVVSRDELTQTCWEGRAVGEDAINRCIQQIRKLGETSNAFRLETIPRVGYRMYVTGEAAVGPPPSDGSSPSGKEQPSRIRPPWLIAAAAAAVILIGGLAWWINLNSRTVDITPTQTLAVLKFDAPQGDAELERFATAVSQAIHDELTQDGQTLVTAARSMELMGARKAEAGQLLNAQMVVDGNVSREGDRVRVGVRFDHTRRNLTIWSSSIDGSLSEPAAVAYRLAAQLRQKLGLTLPISVLNSNVPQAEEKARAWFRVIQQSDEGNDRGAMEAAKAFVAIWPDDPRPRYMQTIETMDALPQLSDEARVIAYREAREAARIALQRDDGDSDGPQVATARATPSYAWGERIALLEQAKALSRQGAAERYWAEDVQRTGRIRLAIETIGMGPRPAKSALVSRAEVLMMQGNKPQADQDLKEGALIYPAHPLFPQLLFESAAWLGSPDEAEALLVNSGVWLLSAADRELLTKYIAARRTPDAKRITAVEDHCASQVSRRDDTTLYYCFSALARLERANAALDVADILFPEMRPSPGEDPDARWLAAPATSWHPIVLYMPWTEELRTDPRIHHVFERLGLLDYWRQSGNWPDFCETEPQSVCAQMKAS